MNVSKYLFIDLLAICGSFTEMHTSLQLALEAESTAQASSHVGFHAQRNDVHSVFLHWNLPDLGGTCLPTFQSDCNGMLLTLFNAEQK